MYNNERVIIDTRKYDIDEMLFRYKQGKIIFYEKKCATWKRREKVVQDIIKALLRGIPFPPVYASELQTGELLILDKSDKLRFLLEYLAHGDVLMMIKMLIMTGIGNEQFYIRQPCYM